jgi:flagellar biosynthesis protein FlhG
VAPASKIGAPRPVAEPPVAEPSAAEPPAARVATQHSAPRATARPGGILKRLTGDTRQRARVLAIASGKGGVGKTNLAVNMAIALAEAGRRVLLVDTDLGLANVDLVLGRRPRGDLGHVLSGRLPLEQVVQEGPAGIRWIPGASHMPSLSRIGERRREALLEGLTDLEGRHDFLLLDAPAGIGQGVMHLARLADELILVTTPEPTAIMDAYALLKGLAASQPATLGQVRLVVNMVGHRGDAERVHQRLRDTAARFLGLSVELLGYVFCDGHVGRAVQKQEPVVLAYPHSQAAWCIRRLAGALMDAEKAPSRPPFAFFRRLANLFAIGQR